jgi:trehalose-phosphatase
MSAVDGSPLPPALRRALTEVARTPRLLIACDYDGTLAPIVDDPALALPLPEAVTALRALAELPSTEAAVISGRELRDLAVMSRLPAEVHLVGSHGSEFDVGFASELPAAVRDLYHRLLAVLAKIAASAEDVLLEVKPAGIAVHTRKATEAVAAQVLREVLGGPGRWKGVHVTEGNAVIDLTLVPTDKGQALDLLRKRFGTTAAVYLGDGISDERALTRMQGPDVGVKVGGDVTNAEHRIGEPIAATRLLAFLLDARRRWLFGEQAVPIERHSLLSNQHSVALVTPAAKVNWMCYPEPDSAALFADLLGGPSAGHFTISPQHGGLPLGQRYLPGTMTVETRWSKLLVTDYLDDDAMVRVVTGTVPAVVEFAPRPEFGQVPVRLTVEPDGLRVVGTADPIVLRSPGVEWEVVSDGEHETARAVVHPSPDTHAVLELRCGSDDLSPFPVAELERRRTAGQPWQDWLATLTLPDVQCDLVARSALTLRALVHKRTGAILAAATTSLPEEVGGVRNWDYRYCWLRDAALTAQALVSLGSLSEAEAYLDWLHDVLDTLPGPERLHPLYTLQGGHLGAEAVIDSLPGYAGSRPVRVGNLASQQVQLDVFGPIVELIRGLAAARGELAERDWQVVTAMVTAVGHRWQEPDHGIWEERHAPRHRVYSRVMCWVTVDRAITIAERFGRPVLESWVILRDCIAADVLKNGWNDEVGAFTTAYDGTDLDAASLHVGLSGLIDPNDEQFQSTVTAIEAELRQGATVYRYRRDDGLPGDEGGFHLCAAWMIEAYLLTGRRTEAEELFGQLVDCAGPTGLLAEEYDPVAERSLGNHPQAYSHLGLIRCAQLLDEVW